MYDLLIVGSGPSGIYAGYLGKLHNLNVIILESNHYYGGQLNLFLEKPVFDLPTLILLHQLLFPQLIQLLYKVCKSEYYLSSCLIVILDL